MHTEIRRCELCSDTAAVYCPSDSAYLCRRCDAAVHAANFLVARHVRSALCSGCGDFSGDRFSGPGVRRCARDLCGSCVQRSSDHRGSDVEDSSLSSVSLSTTESSAAGQPVSKVSSGEVSSKRATRRRPRRTKVDAITEDVLVNWCKRLGLDGNSGDRVVATAARVFRRLKGVPVRVALATSFWVGVRFCGDKEGATWRNLVRVEKIVGVPAKVILSVEGKLGRVLKARGRILKESDYKEGWAEC